MPDTPISSPSTSNTGKATDEIQRAPDGVTSSSSNSIASPVVITVRSRSETIGTQWGGQDVLVAGADEVGRVPSRRATRTAD